MEVFFKTSLQRDLKKAPVEIRYKVSLVVIEIESATKLGEISNLKKLKGNPFAYRVKIDNYRLCFFLENEIITLVRFLPRKDVYKLFP